MDRAVVENRESVSTDGAELLESRHPSVIVASNGLPDPIADVVR